MLGTIVLLLFELFVSLVDLQEQQQLGSVAVGGGYATLATIAGEVQTMESTQKTYVENFERRINAYLPSLAAREIFPPFRLTSKRTFKKVDRDVDPIFE
jgi:hypothetical protein